MTDDRGTAEAETGGGEDWRANSSRARAVPSNDEELAVARDSAPQPGVAVSAVPRAAGVGLFVLALLGALYFARAVVLPLLLAFLLNFIPYLGAMVGVAVVAVVAFLTFDAAATAVVPPLVYLGLTALEGSFITPTILGNRLTLNPLMIFAGIIFWGWMWGVVGALLAVPLLASAKIVCDHVERLKPVGELLGR